MIDPLSQRSSVLEPDPCSWLNSDRLLQLQFDFLSSRSSLAISGVLRTALKGWIRQQLSLESPLSSEDQSALITSLEPEWRKKADPIAMGLFDSEIHAKFCVSPSCEAWASSNWGHRLETLFLEQKDQLDLASCKLLRVSDKGLSQELYHRLKSKEQSFSTLSQLYGEGPEKDQAGLISLRSLPAMPYGLGKILPTLKVGEVLKPRRLGEYIAIVQLEELRLARFDSVTKSKLLRDELERWLEVTTDLAVAHLMCLDRLESVVP